MQIFCLDFEYYFMPVLNSNQTCHRFRWLHLPPSSFSYVEAMNSSKGTKGTDSLKMAARPNKKKQVEALIPKKNLFQKMTPFLIYQLKLWYVWTLILTCYTLDFRKDFTSIHNNFLFVWEWEGTSLYKISINTTTL